MQRRKILTDESKTLKSYYYSNPDRKKIDYIRRKVNEETNERSQGKDERFLFNLVENKKILAGCYGKRYFNSLHVYLIWVDNKRRGLGYGTKLMNLVENLALEKKCEFVTLNTIVNEDANQFYLKLGYKMDLERTGYTDNGRACSFIKRLKES